MCYTYGYNVAGPAAVQIADWIHIAFVFLLRQNADVIFENSITESHFANADELLYCGSISSKRNIPRLISRCSVGRLHFLSLAHNTFGIFTHTNQAPNKWILASILYVKENAFVCVK